ncbi:hypothetical protein ABXT70_00805 [Candidatus Njordibacter sp. Uisw_039]|uniref:hypothetical protein n=1 Tax=Candidatus Njordibacter sp. Uisw_039 TaxID=3230972 RepID=UPI003D479EE7
MTFIIKDPKAESFNYTLDSSSAELAALVDKLFKETKLNRHTIHKKTLKLILLNLIVHKGSKVLISRDNNSTSLARYNALDVGVTAINTVTDKLEKSEYIHLITGKNLPYGHGIRSSIQATDSLNTLLKPITLQLVPSELVLIREGGSKKLIDYTDTPRTVRIRKELTAYNKLIKSVNIELRDSSGLTVLKDLNHQVVQRKFIDNGELDIQGRPLFNSGGRSNSAWMSLSGSDERPNIFIDGQPTLELDYQSSAINIIYKALTGVLYMGDPYALSVRGIDIPRNLVKRVATCSLNATKEKGPSAAVGKAYGKLRTSLKVEDQIDYNDYLRIKDKKKVKIIDILQVFLNKHRSISHMFLKGKQVGNKVQCLESDLVFAVVNELTNRSIPTLTVHDSFIVKATDKATLDTLKTTTAFPDQDLVKGLI